MGNSEYKTNSIMGYEGGGYSGCIWEPNFAFIDFEGVVHNLLSTGAAGLFRDGKPQHHCTQEDLCTFIRSEAFCSSANPSYYDIASPADMDELVLNYRADFVLEACHKAHNLSMDLFDKGLLLKCMDCGERVNPIEMRIDEGSYRGDGGIGMVFDWFACSECMCGKACDVCGSYTHPDEWALDNSGYHMCKSCLLRGEYDHPEIAEIVGQMNRCTKQLAIMCEQMPHNTGEYQRHHNAGMYTMMEEIMEVFRKNDECRC